MDSSVEWPSESQEQVEQVHLYLDIGALEFRAISIAVRIVV